MGTAKSWGMNMQSIEILAPRYGIAWYPWAVQYFFLVALAYSAIWFAAPGLLRGRITPLSRLALLVAASTALVAPVSLLADLHQPLRFWHFYAHFTPWSWMSLGSILMPVFVGGTLALAWLVWREALRDYRGGNSFYSRLARFFMLGSWTTPHGAVVAMTILSLIGSILVAIYTGSEVAILKSRPLWHTPFLPVMFVLTGFVGAAGLILVMNRVSLRDPVATRQMLRAVFVFCAASGAVASLWLVLGLLGKSPAAAVAIDSVRFDPEWRGTTLRAFIAGAALAIGSFVLIRSRGPMTKLYWLAGLMAIHVAWMFRWVVLMNVQTVAKHTAGFNEYHLSRGSEGLMGIVGTFALWLAVVLVIDIFVPWRGDDTAAAKNAQYRKGPAHG